MSLSDLPVEILLLIAAFLDESNLSCLTQSLPSLKEHIAAETFCPWRKRCRSFSEALTLFINTNNGECFDKTLNEYFTELNLPLGHAMKLYNVFDVLIHIEAAAPRHLRLSPLLGDDATDATLGLIHTRLERHVGSLEIVRTSIRLQTPCKKVHNTYMLLTACLLHTILQPRDVFVVLTRGNGNQPYIYVDTRALNEYFSLLLLCSRLCDVDRHLRSQEAMPVGISELLTDTGHSALSRQALFILDRRLQSFQDDFYAPPTFITREPPEQPPPPPATPSRRPCVPRFPVKLKPSPYLTTEQAQYVGAAITVRDLVKIRAYAGTGKSTSCVEFARMRPSSKILYIAYNKAAKLDADRSFRSCPNVTCKTLHAVARNVLKVVNPVVYAKLSQAQSSQEPMSYSPRKSWKSTPRFSQASEGIEIGNIDSIAVEAVLSLTDEQAKACFSTNPRRRNRLRTSNKPSSACKTVSRVLAATINTFCWSGEDTINALHLPQTTVEKRGLDPNKLVPLGNKLWSLIADGLLSTISHDCYLKMLSLDRSDASNAAAFGYYDVIIFDEAQDANACMAEIVLRQQGRCAVVVLGDPYQNIYGFRGARNECFDDEKFPPTMTFRLTQSFRFGGGVAKVASTFLTYVGELVPVQGMRRSSECGGGRDLPGVFACCTAYGGDKYSGDPVVRSSERYTMIFNKNSSLIRHSLRYCVAYPDAKICIRASASNPPDKIYAFLHEACDLYHENHSHRPKHKSLRPFASFIELKSWYLANLDSEGDVDDDIDFFLVSVAIDMEPMISRTPDFQALLQHCESMITGEEKVAEIVLTTTHQAKGLEWDHVVISNDFAIPLANLRLERGKAHRFWVSLAYVACTRARKQLMLSEKLTRLMHVHLGSHRFYISPVSSSSTCPSCVRLQWCDKLGTAIKKGNEEVDTRINSGDLDTPSSTLIGYEAIIPPANLSSPSWLHQPRTSNHPVEIHGRSSIDCIACSNCILSWYLLDPGMDQDLTLFAANMRKCNEATVMMTPSMQAIQTSYKLLATRPRTMTNTLLSRISDQVWSVGYKGAWPFRDNWSDVVYVLVQSEAFYGDDDDEELDDYWLNDDGVLVKVDQGFAR